MNRYRAAGNAAPAGAGNSDQIARVLGLLDKARTGAGGALLVDGPPGSGKSQLLRDVLSGATGIKIIRLDGFEVESRIPAAGLSHLDGYISHPSTGFLSGISIDDPLGSAMSLLARLSELSRVEPVALVGDDAHWLDPFSLNVLGLVGRRVETSGVAVVLAGEFTAAVRRNLAGIDRVSLGIPDREVERAARCSTRNISADMRLLGAFSVTVDGHVLGIAEGTPATLLKVVALRGQVPAEEVEEILWPGAGPGVGRTRMRNVIHRVRNMYGPLIERDGRMLRLAPGVHVDAHAFEEQAIKAVAALEAQVEDATRFAREALSLYSGELLPVDRNADWSAAARDRLSRLCLSLFDHLEVEASTRGDVADALQAIERAIELDPYDESRYMRGARLLAANGSTPLAVGLLRRGQAAMSALDLRVSTAFGDLLERFSS